MVFNSDFFILTLVVLALVVMSGLAGFMLGRQYERNYQSSQG